jgi:hypothetical protein
MTLELSRKRQSSEIFFIRSQSKGMKRPTDYGQRVCRSAVELFRPGEISFVLAEEFDIVDDRQHSVDIERLTDENREFLLVSDEDLTIVHLVHH